MSLTNSEISRAQEAWAFDNYISELRYLIVMMAHLALDSEETNQSVIRPGLLRLASKVVSRMGLEFYDDIKLLGEEHHGRWDALLSDEVRAADGSINGREAMRAMYHELKQGGFEQRFFDD